MSDIIILAIVSAIPATVTAAAGLIVSIKNGQKVDVVVGKTDDAALKQEHIRELVNSNLTKVKTDLEEAKSEILSLKALVKKLTDANFNN